MCLAWVVSGCATAPPAPIEFTDQESIEATVTAVDPDNSLLSLRGADGGEITILVPGARNLAQVEPGDTLKASYFVTYRASMAEAGSAPSGVELTTGRSAAGERPGAFVGAQSATTVEVVSVAEDGSSVSFRDAEGQLDSMTVEREEGRAFARALKRGDLVTLEYAAAVAIEVEEPGSTD
jgi:hypothetical protein